MMRTVVGKFFDLVAEVNMTDRRNGGRIRENAGFFASLVLGLLLGLALASIMPAGSQLAMLASVLATAAFVYIMLALYYREAMNASRLNHWDAALAHFALSLLFALFVEVRPALAMAMPGGG